MAVPTQTESGCAPGNSLSSRTLPAMTMLSPGYQKTGWHGKGRAAGLFSCEQHRRDLLELSMSPIAGTATQAQVLLHFVSGQMPAAPEGAPQGQQWAYVSLFLLGVTMSLITTGVPARRVRASSCFSSSSAWTQPWVMWPWRCAKCYISPRKVPGNGQGPGALRQCQAETCMSHMQCREVSHGGDLTPYQTSTAGTPERYLQ